ncbi:MULTISPECIES: RCC1 domain-containing protein [unclassified Corallococcus]|uniref:RCC1 domain-containing protein n=1 Tax=unclassified Corallococcus TaxID=2685029 RepID=UPI001A8C83C0|nr:MULTISPECIES: hypothetical protein [unclassified Corallococcus]MBN9688397.1 hypothetical protein [Corallococcus sp. NCSPR001]WAS87803.1 hypothetical protein O0N60_12675 [Corallococcus sp. NCRR]
MSLSVRGLAVLAVLACLVPGCRDASTAAVDVVTSLQLETPDEDVASVQVTVSGPDMPARTVTLKKEAGRWSGVLRAVPVGAGHTFVGAALDGSGARLHEATVSDVALTEEAGSAAVYLLLPSSQPASDVPVVTSLVASPGDLSVGQAVSLTATVRGTETGGAPAAAWTSSADGDFSDSSALQTTWTGSRVADAALTLTLTQARGPSGVLTVKLPVHNAKPLSEVFFNVSPYVASARSTPETGVGEAAALAVTSVDLEGETLTHAWKASCVGVFEDITAATTRFTPTAQPPVVGCKPCDLTVIVTDPHGGRAQETVSTCVRPGAALPVLAEGNGHFLVIRPGGTVWAWGNNAVGQLGTGSPATSEPVPAQVPGLTDIVAVSAASGYSLALRADGTLFAWGDNTSGQLANGDLATIRRTPVVVEGLPRIAAIATMNVYSLVLGVDGTVWSWGNGSPLLSRVDVPSGISAVATELMHGVALHETGTVFTWASSGSGKATAPTRIDSLSGIVAISSGMSSSLALGADGTVYTWGAGAEPGARTVPVRVPGLSRVAAIGSGGSFNATLSTALRDDGSLYTWASYFPSPQRVDSLPAMSRLGESSCIAQRADGAVFTWCNATLDPVQVLSGSPAEQR